MQPNDDPKHREPDAPHPSAVQFASNEVRLTVRQWLIAAALLIALFYFIPVLWPWIEPLKLQPDHRFPYRLGHDYWAYQRYCGAVCSQQMTPIIGDSVIWGDYVTRRQTLSHYLNRLAGEERFANLGLNGAHPAAMAGLVQYYARDVADRDVLLHCNLLWTCSKQRDLQTDKELMFHHPRLVPQFVPWIACHKESLSNRLGIVIERRVPLLSWAGHLRIAYFDDSDVPRWTIEHPYQNPAGAVTLRLPSPDEPRPDQPLARPWTEKRIPPQDFPWVQLESSLQWRLFKQTVATLRSRGNRPFVLVGPLNEHMLTEASRRTYAQRKRQAAAWLDQQGVAYCVASLLPSRLYADASHPLAEGYELLAEELSENESFRRFRSAGRSPAVDAP